MRIYSWKLFWLSISSGKCVGSRQKKSKKRFSFWISGQSESSVWNITGVAVGKKKKPFPECDTSLSLGHYCQSVNRMVGVGASKAEMTGLQLGAWLDHWTARGPSKFIDPLLVPGSRSRPPSCSCPFNWTLYQCWSSSLILIASPSK